MKEDEELLKRKAQNRKVSLEKKTHCVLGGQFPVGRDAGRDSNQLRRRR